MTDSMTLVTLIPVPPFTRARDGYKQINSHKRHSLHKKPAFPPFSGDYPPRASSPGQSFTHTGAVSFLVLFAPKKSFGK
jgi:hypothetical protein